jgi:hypothetical protein
MFERAQLLDHRCHVVRSWWSPLRSPLSLLPIRHSLLTAFPASRQKKRGENGESKKEKGNRKKYRAPIGAALPSPLSHGGVGLDFFHYYAKPYAKTHEAWVYVGGEAQGLSGGEGPRIPHACGRTFYERGFSGPLHQFLSSHLWYYVLELHYLAPSGVLHIMAFVTLCEAYLGIYPDLDL